MAREALSSTRLEPGEENVRFSPTSIFLIGYRGSGKTTLGRLLAQRSGATFVDTDEVVEQTIRKSISQCFVEDGEARFREEESAALEAACQNIAGGARCVIATGGGIVLDPRNVARMRRAGLVIWLSASVETIRQRIEADPRTADSRPALGGKGTASEEVEAMLDRRIPLYRTACQLVITTDGETPEALADAILEHLSSQSESQSPGKAT